MASKFSELPNNLIIKIVQIENDRKKCEKERMKFGEVIQELNKLSTTEYFCHTIDVGRTCAEPTSSVTSLRLRIIERTTIKLLNN